MVGRQRGVTFNKCDLVDIDAKFFGCDLRHSDAQPLAQIDLAAEQRHSAVAVDRQEGVDFLGIEDSFCHGGALRADARGEAREREADGDRSAFKDGAAGDVESFDRCVHVSLSVRLPP